jgi:holo-[acyl-carrier protein] synthase
MGFRTFPSTTRVGIDLVSVRRIAASVAEFGDRFLQRVFTPHELATCDGSPDERARRLASRFAAKEATLKVLRPDRHWVDWRTIEVRRFEAGHCEIELHGAASELAIKAGIGALSVSLTHEDEYAGAVVVGERATARGRIRASGPVAHAMRGARSGASKVRCWSR